LWSQHSVATSLHFARPPVTLLLLTPRPSPRSLIFPCPTLFRSHRPGDAHRRSGRRGVPLPAGPRFHSEHGRNGTEGQQAVGPLRSEEHTSELQSRENLVCRLLLEKKKTGERMCIV